MSVLVTGASGFLGRAVVAAAARSGHKVVAMVRADATTDSLPPGTEVLRGDLRQPALWRDQLGDVRVVVHLAASPTGDLAEQLEGTVVGTENLLNALDLGSVERFVHVSSFSVYDFHSPAEGAAIDEDSALEAHPQLRDAYTTTKLVQERLVRERCRAAGTPLVVLRPGAIYGPGKDWSCGAALTVGPIGLVFSPQALFRLTYVDNCADAVVRAIDAPNAAGRTLDVVDDGLPTHWQYFRRCTAAAGKSRWALPVPWLVVVTVGRILRVCDERIGHNRARFPEFLSLRRQEARWKPFTYPNDAAKAALGWAPRVPLAAGIRATMEHT
ncbi:MAG: NAD(P)-dependent oxidoreductase [Ilumatobacteraceae bacterium]